MRGWFWMGSLLCVACSASHPRERAPVDIDGDGRDELLVRQSWDGRVRALSIDGVLGPTVLDSAFDETVFRVGDLNGDGRGDLAVRAPGERMEQVRVHLGRADGTAEPSPFFVLDVAGSLRNAKAAGDVDGDGLDDLVAVGFAGPSFVVYGDPAEPRVSGPFDFGGEVHARIDLDGDGRADLLSTDHDFEDRRDEHRVLLGGSDRLLEVPATSTFAASVPDPGHPRRDLLAAALLTDTGIFSNGVERWTGAGFAPAGVAVAGVPIGSGQIIGDEQTDVVVRVVTFDTASCLTHVGPLGQMPVATLETVGGGCGSVTVGVAGDLDGDDFDDLVEWVWSDEGARGLRIHRGGRDALVEGVTVLPAFEEAFQPLVDAMLFSAGDLDADGDPDLLGAYGTCAVAVRGGRAPLLAELLCDTERLGPTPLPPTPVGPQDARPGDEVVVPGLGLVSFGGGAIEVLTTAVRGLEATAVGDIDDDGFVDLIDGVVYAGGPGVLSDPPVVLDLGGRVAATWLGDVNGDGVDDVAVGTGVRFGGPDVTSRPNDVELAPFVGEAVRHIVAVGDLDGDGLADVGVALVEGDTTVVVSLAAGVPVERERIHALIRALGDVDGDGRAEVLRGRDVVMTSTGERVYVASRMVVGAGDVDGDGRVELLDTFEPSPSLLRWNGAALEDVLIERPIPIEEFVLAPLL